MDVSVVATISTEIAVEMLQSLATDIQGLASSALPIVDKVLAEAENCEPKLEP